MKEEQYRFYGWEHAVVPAVGEGYQRVQTPRRLYDLLSELWCADTCAPRLRTDWTPSNRTLGQCSITAFLAQDIFGGQVYGILRPGGNYHCYNVIGTCVFDLTSEQFGDEVLSYEENPEQLREVHFQKEEKRLRYEYLKEQLRKKLAAEEMLENAHPLLLTIQVRNQEGEVREEVTSEHQARLLMTQSFSEGDRIVILAGAAPCFVRVQLGGILSETILYLKEGRFEFPVPFGEQLQPYPVDAFTAETFLVTAERVEREALPEKRNLCRNPYDTAINQTAFPHAWANVETRNSPQFLASNAIDGNCRNESHGDWPYESWGINRDPDAALTVEFGRMVTVREVVLVTRADFPHDSFWERATLAFSDGSEVVMPLVKTAAPQMIAFPEKTVSWVRLYQLIKTKTDDSPFPALSQIEVYGGEIDPLLD